MATVVATPGTLVNDAAIGEVAWKANDFTSAPIASEVQSSNNVYATIQLSFLSSTNDSNYLKATNFGISLPAGSTIDGISARIEKKQNLSVGIQDWFVRLVDDAGTIRTAVNKAAGQWPTTDGYATYGTSTDLWGESAGFWTEAKVEDVDFGIVLAATNTSSTGGRTGSVDHIEITIHYTEPPTPKAGSDTGTGTDQKTNRDIGLSESGAGTDTPTVKDSSTTDSGTSADVIQLFDRKVTDSGVGVDSTTVAAITPIVGADTGSGSDSSVRLDILVTDSGSLTDTIVSFEMTLQEAGIGTELSYLEFLLVESGVGADTASIPEVIFNVSDTGSGSEAAYIGLNLPIPAVARVDYRIVVADLNGVPIDEVPAKNLSFSYVVNAPGAISFTLPLLHPKSQKSLLDPGKRELHVYRNGDKVWGGYLWTVGASSNEDSIRIAGEGYYGRLRRRIIDTELLHTNTEQLNIAWNIINYLNGRWNHGITRWSGETPSGVTRDQNYHTWEYVNAGQALETLARLRNGFDFEVDSDKVWKAYYPVIGRRNTQFVFELGANVATISYDIDASETITELFGTGAGQDDWTCRVTVTAGGADSTAQYGLLQDVMNFGDIKKYTTLQQRTLEELRLRSGQRMQPQLLVHLDDPPWGSYHLGDECRVRADKGYIDLDQFLRIISIAVNISDEGREATSVFFDKVVA